MLYEYYWEFNFPSTPTTFALRTDDYKLIQYHGIWDTEELYDMHNDPKEMRNLIGDPRYLPIVASMRQQLFKRLENNRGQHVVPYTEKFSSGAVFRERDRSKAAEFPARWLKKDTDKGLEDFFVPDYRRVEARKKRPSKRHRSLINWQPARRKTPHEAIPVTVFDWYAGKSGQWAAYTGLQES